MGICVLIPTYNNQRTLGRVVQDVLEYCEDVIVINDGSTDDTAQILEAIPQIQVLAHTPNKGKGFTLRKVLKYAAEQGFQYAITIDSDGQHFAKDIPVFLQRIGEEPGKLLIGARNMEQASVPGKSSFGNKFSNFWFWIETGLKGPDTQSGYRLYPVQALRKMHFFTRKFEFEIEVLVRASWAGIPIEWVPVTVYYAPKETRVSHFRPVRDFTRVGILHTISVLIALAYTRPRDFIRSMFNKKKRRAILDKYVFCPGESDERKAASLGFGVFMGIVPIWGFQLMVAIPLSILFKLNKALVILAANISIPPMIPLILFFSHRMGAVWMGENAVSLNFSNDLTIDRIRQNLEQYLYGSVTLAIVAGVLTTIISWLLMKIAKRKSRQLA